jgi:hypothetical protein
MTLERWALNFGTDEQIRDNVDLTANATERAISVMKSLPAGVREKIHTVRATESKIYGESILIICDPDAEGLLWGVEALGGLWLGAVGLFAVKEFEHEY